MRARKRGGGEEEEEEEEEEGRRRGVGVGVGVAINYYLMSKNTAFRSHFQRKLQLTRLTEREKEVKRTFFTRDKHT